MWQYWIPGEGRASDQCVVETLLELPPADTGSKTRYVACRKVSVPQSWYGLLLDDLYTVVSIGGTPFDFVSCCL
jgi:hypothetical protein